LATKSFDFAGISLMQHDRHSTIEHIHDEVKNGLGVGQLPITKFGANAGWFRIACIA
jgi:hypothetical protein